MSGDLGPRAAICATEDFLSLHPDVDVTLVGDQSQLTPFLVKSRHFGNQLSLLHAPGIVAMNDEPLLALRQKKDSSMWMALDYLRAGNTDACVSAGNTGALLAMSKYLVKTFPGIDRPAICKSMPVTSGVTYLLDLGANINCSAETLRQFALMGSVLADVTGIKAPRVALLNIGSESHKGTETLQAAQELLRGDLRINYVGFVEANDIFSGREHVIVCDGFYGNIALKASEGVARYISSKMSATIGSNPFNRLLALLAFPLLNQLREELDPSLYNGASLLGLKRIVIKSHGGANRKAFAQALMVARDQVAMAVPERIAKSLTLS